MQFFMIQINKVRLPIEYELPMTMRRNRTPVGSEEYCPGEEAYEREDLSGLESRGSAGTY